ncbi:MAG: phosphoribosyltransferase family protein [Candidatus Spechtbacterales bacterium]
MYEPACPHCETRLPFGELPKECRQEVKLHRVFTSGLYSDATLNGLIKDLKYKGAWRLAEPLARFAYWQLDQGGYAEVIKEKVDIIIPVPLHKNKLKRRGFNHTQKIAEHLSELLDIPLEIDALVKSKKTDSQVETGSREEREKNLAGAFAITNTQVQPVYKTPHTGSTCVSPIFNKTVLLVDDVITTGSTLRECALALRFPYKCANAKHKTCELGSRCYMKQYVREVWGLTVAKD